jgi:hypothetical protein
MSTARLVHIISSVQRGRGSGELTAWRGEGILYEEGSIVFANGQVARASTGRRRGSEALNWLSTWDNCSYRFVPAWEEAKANQPPLPIQEKSTGTLAYGPPANPPNSSPSTPQTPLPDSLAEQKMPRIAGARARSEGKGPAGIPASAVAYPTLQLAAALRLIEQHGLSRGHRQLFYLLDGRRSIADLERLMRKGRSEISELLQDLERVHAISIK